MRNIPSHSQDGYFLKIYLKKIIDAIIKNEQESRKK